MSDTDEIQTLHALNDAQAAEIARLTAELERCREGADATMAILTAIHALLYPPVVHTRQGIRLRFDPENPGEWAQRISDAIRDIRATIIDAAPKVMP